uniref:Uncharacterized protein n=2 Tax=Lygus hesperus TaxID=30085 RepID=A0A0A9Y1Y5_LYGHE
MQCEDEWSEMHQRFKKEGLDADSLKLEDRLLQVWRWLVDAESNLRNSRRMLDKLYEQQHEEIEEMENYVGKMKKLAEKRATDVEAECSVLKLEKTELLELLDGFGALGDSIYEKVLFLGEEKVKAAEDLEILKNMKLPSNGVNSDILTEMIKVSSEKESLKREVTEMRERIHLLEKSSRQLEIDNDRLSFKVNDQASGTAITEINKVISLKVQWKHVRTRVESSHLRSNCPTHYIKNSPRVMADSTPPSLLMSELASIGSPKKLSSLLESCNELARVEEIKKLQHESESLRSQLTLLGEKYNALALKHIHYKSKRDFKWKN